MSELILIAAVAQNLCIGKEGRLPWYFSEDLKRFKALTTGNVVVMGRKTFSSMGNRPLPNRKNILITKTDEVRSYGEICFAR